MAAREPKRPATPWWLRLLPSPIPEPVDSRVSIWSIQARDARTFFRIAALLWLAALIHLGYKPSHQPSHDGAADGAHGWMSSGELALAILSDFNGVAIGIAVVAMLATRPLHLTGGLLMSLYQTMVNRFVIPVIEEHEARGRAQGLEEGRAAGLEEGRTAGLEEGRTAGLEEGRTAGLEEGRTAGLEEGHAKAQAMWRAWNQRRLDAERQGRGFAEPPPE